MQFGIAKRSSLGYVQIYLHLCVFNLHIYTLWLYVWWGGDDGNGELLDRKLRVMCGLICEWALLEEPHSPSYIPTGSQTCFYAVMLLMAPDSRLWFLRLTLEHVTKWEEWFTCPLEDGD